MKNVKRNNRLPYPDFRKQEGGHLFSVEEFSRYSLLKGGGVEGLSSFFTSSSLLS